MRRSRHPWWAIIALLGLWPQSAHAAAGEPQGMGMLVLKSTVALAVVLALFALAVWGMRKLQGHLATQGARALSMESRISLDTRNSLAIVRHGERRWLVGISPAGITRIDSLDEPRTTNPRESA